MSETATQARTLWRALNKHFRVITAPIDSFIHPSSYRLMGADLLPGLLDGKRPREIARVLSGATPEMLETLRRWRGSTSSEQVTPSRRSRCAT